MRRKLILAGAVLTLAAAAFLAWPSRAGDKLPKCSMPLCRSVGCSPDTLCAKGATVVSCADICNGH